MRHPAPRCLVLLLGAAACSNNSLGKFNTAPNVSILNPTDGAEFSGGELIEFNGVAIDDQDDSSALTIQWSSNIDGVLSTEPADSNGDVVFSTNSLSGGEHVITLQAVDTAGDSSQTSIVVTTDGEGGGSTIGQGSPPTVLIIGPDPEVDGPWLFGQILTLVGAATDPDQPDDTLQLTVVSQRDGLVWEGSPAADGRVDIDLDTLSTGSHVLELQALDDDANTGKDTLEVEILADGRPIVQIDSPASGSQVWTTDSARFEGTVEDIEDDVELLELTWESSLDGILFEGAADSSGVTLVNASLSEGVHTITLTAVDTDDKEGTASVVVESIDPLNDDGDLDGYTENEGDCDDGDPSINPGRSEACDALDNDCDGDVNEDWWDSYEPNDVVGDAYDLGVVDGSVIWEGGSVGISGLTLHEEYEEDWFILDADDDWYDNVSIGVTVTGLPAAGSYTVELLLDTGSGYTVQSSATGYGSIYVYKTGDTWDGDEDDWAIRVYSNSWAPQCSAPYSIQISV